MKGIEAVKINGHSLSLIFLNYNSVMIHIYIHVYVSASV